MNPGDPPPQRGPSRSQDPPQDSSQRRGELLLYVDGACAGNPGPAGAAAILKDTDGDTLLERARAFGPATNNVAEYQALILGLEMAAELRPKVLTIHTDSELVVRQLAGHYKVRAPHLKPLYRRVQQLLEPFEAVQIQCIGRHENTEADRLARKALKKARQVDAELPAEARKSGPGKKFRLK